MPIRARYLLPLFAVIRIFPVDLRGFSCPRPASTSAKKCGQKQMTWP
jgi:hypothetical protein